ncbi:MULTISPECIES: hypothetical protein [Lactobacillaceae]|uniref:hypothetical protein n=1 Tax=Lactobacillaceae TaxID=33958 RepID=UPI0014564753|nr:hypothetical protein [Lactobacillus sp. HBUAS51381]NLR10723.1 hypothetical protein [Lactobacillus sp. HBUAS51381]
MHKGIVRQIWFWGGLILGLYALLVISSVPMLGLIQWSGVHGIANNVGIRVLSTLVMIVVSALIVWWIYRYHTDLWLRQVITAQHVAWSIGAAAVGTLALLLIAITLGVSDAQGLPPLMPGTLVKLVVGVFTVFVFSLLSVWVLQGMFQERLNRLPDFPKWAAVLLPIICYILVAWGTLSDNLSALVVSTLVAGIYQVTRDWQCSWGVMAVLTAVSLGLPLVG